MVKHFTNNSNNGIWDLWPVLFWHFDFPFDEESDRERHGVYWLVLNGEITVKRELLYPNFVLYIRDYEHTCKRYLMLLWFDCMLLRSLPVNPFFFFFSELLIFFHSFHPKYLDRLSSDSALKADHGYTTGGGEEVTKDVGGYLRRVYQSRVLQKNLKHWGTSPGVRRVSLCHTSGSPVCFNLLFLMSS